MLSEFEKICPFSKEACHSDRCALGSFGNPEFPCSIKEYLYLIWNCQEEIKEKLDKVISEIGNIN